MKRPPLSLARLRRVPALLAAAATLTAAWGPGLSAAGEPPPTTVRTLVSRGFPSKGIGPGKLTPVVLGNSLFFMPLSAERESMGLWKVSLTGPSEPRQVGDFKLPEFDSETPLGKLGSKLYLWHRGQLLSWTEDSTAPTVEPPTLTAGVPGPFLFERNGRAHFMVRETGAETGLWSTDGSSLKRELTLTGSYPGAVLHGDVIVTSDQDSLSWFKSPEETGDYITGRENMWNISIFGARSLNGRLLLWHGAHISAVQGTEPGFVRVSDDAESTMTILGDHAYFLKGDRLWKTDGTAEGTSRVSDSIEVPGPVYAVNGALYFLGRENFGDYGVYRSDGSSGGTVVVKKPAYLIGAGESLLYMRVFTGVTPNSRSGIWVTDGTPEGTKFLKDDTPTGYSTAQETYRIGGNQMLFQVNNIPWRSDGTPEGTRPLFPETPVTGPTLWANQTPVPAGNRVYFKAGDPQEDYGLWVADTATGAARLHTDGAVASVGLIRPFGGGKDLYGLSHSNGTWSLCKTDGTPEGSELLKVFLRGPYAPAELVVSGGYGWFFAGWPGDNPGRVTLVRTDGTAAGTVAVKGGFLHDYWFNPYALTPSGTGLLFTGSTDVWHSDGTEAGTKPVTPGQVKSSDYTPPFILVSEGKAFVQRYREVWTDAGTPLTFRKLADGKMLTAAAGRVYFAPEAGGVRFASSDGTEGGLVEAAPEPAEPGFVFASGAACVGDTVYLQTNHRPGLDPAPWTRRLRAYDAVTLSRHPLAEDRVLNLYSGGANSGLVPVGDMVAYTHQVDADSPVELYLAGKTEAWEVPGGVLAGALSKISNLAPEGNKLYYITTGVSGQELRALTVGETTAGGASLRVISHLPGRGTVTGDADGITEAGEKLITATPAAGYYFSHWGGAGIVDPLSAATAVTVSPETPLHEVTAFFSVMPQSLAEWTAAFELSGADAEAGAAPAGDGAANLLKHAFALIPTDPAAVLRTGDAQGGLPLITVEPAEGGGLALRYEYVRRTWMRSLCVPEHSPDGSTWTAATAAPVVTPVDDDVERVVILQPLPADTARAFGRVRVTLE